MPALPIGMYYRIKKFVLVQVNKTKIFYHRGHGGHREKLYIVNSVHSVANCSLDFDSLVISAKVCKRRRT